MKKMKPSALIRAIMASVITLALVFITVYGRKLVEKEGLVYSGDINTALVVEDNNKEESKEEIKEEEVQEETVEEEVKASERVEVFDGLTIEELTAKLDRNLGSDLSGIFCGTAVIRYYFYRNDIRFYYPVHECGSIYFGSTARRHSERGYRTERSSQSAWHQSGGYLEGHCASAGIESGLSVDDQ